VGRGQGAVRTASVGRGKVEEKRYMRGKEEKMREIKFRVWDTYRNKMIKWDELHSDSNYLYIKMFNANGYRTRVMQYTGLKDKNGREIYEGDVVEYKDLISGKKGKGVVKFENASFCIDDGLIKAFRWICYEVEIISNVFDNPVE